VRGVLRETVDAVEHVDIRVRPLECEFSHLPRPLIFHARERLGVLPAPVVVERLLP
jgi:hypothetical protein